MGRSKAPRTKVRVPLPKASTGTEEEYRDWNQPTPEWPLLMEIRMGYHRALLTGSKRKIENAFKAWRDFLHVPQTKKA